MRRPVAPFKYRWILLFVLFTSVVCRAEETYSDLGRAATEKEIRAWDTDVRYDGLGLPDGQGTYEEGKDIYKAQCAACHGEKLEGVPELGRGPLIGPGLTVSSHWPYAPTLFDFIRRAMPFNAPASLSDDEVYALCAYILVEGGIHSADQPMNANVLSNIKMPNSDNFIPDPRPDTGHSGKKAR